VLVPSEGQNRARELTRSVLSEVAGASNSIKICTGEHSKVVQSRERPVQERGKGLHCKVFGGATLATLPVTRVKRRYTKSTFAAARVVPVLGVKETRCTVRVWPGARMEASVAPRNNELGTTSPLSST